MTNYGVMQVGRLSLRENDSVDFSIKDDGQTVVLSLEGQESVDRLGYTSTKKRLDDIAALNRTFVPVTFSHKAELNGYYRVASVTGTSRSWMPESKNIVPWTMTMERVGYPNEINIESRLSGPITRANDHTATGKRWQAPPVGHFAYAAGSTTPLFVTRTSADGSILAYYNLPQSINPRWAATVSNYLLGRVRFQDSDGTERTALSAPAGPTGWTLSNGLVRLQLNASTGVFEVSAWTGGAWQMKGWELFHSTGPAVTLGVPSAVVVLRNDFEVGTVRIVKTLSPGRVTVDFTLRRGSRFLEIYVQHLFGTTLKLVRSAVEASSASTGYIKATSADGAGNKFVLGSARSFTADNVNGGISKTTTPTLDAFVGVEIAAAPTGDAAVDLFQQYLGSPAELVQGVKF
jgi:hypothetical protein